MAGSCWLLSLIFLILRLRQKLKVQGLRFDISDLFVCLAVMLELGSRMVGSSVLYASSRVPPGGVVADGGRVYDDQFQSRYMMVFPRQSVSCDEGGLIR